MQSKLSGVQEVKYIFSKMSGEKYHRDPHPLCPYLMKLIISNHVNKMELQHA